MNKSKKKIIKNLIVFLLLIFSIIISFYTFINSFDFKLSALRKYLLPYSYISRLENDLKIKTIFNNQNIQNNNLILNHMNLPLMEMEFKESLNPIKAVKSSLILDENLKVITYNFLNGFYAGITRKFPGSGYVDFNNKNIFILSSRGVLAYTDDIEKLSFSQIKNNINDFINLNQFNKSLWFSIKDFLIYKDKIFISYTREVKPDCWNISVISGNLNLNNIEFKNYFDSQDCIHSIDNSDGEFDGSQSGGRLYGYDNSIYLSVGDFRSRHLSQNPQSINGKVLKLNFKNPLDYQIISMGHRNPQGLLVVDHNFIFETEHGPFGGDEVNLIKFESNLHIPNFGWPKSSYGKHYSKSSNEKYPLKKSHKDFGFVEPIKEFTPSIGLSQIEKIYDNLYVVGSMEGGLLYLFRHNDDSNFKIIKKFQINNRIRDIKVNDENLFLFLENTNTLGVIKIKDLLEIANN